MLLNAPMKNVMKIRPVLVLLAALTSAAISLLPAQQKSASNQEITQDKGAPQKKEAPPMKSMTGCVDEQDGVYVLTDGPELKPVANLEAVGFPQEGFAKHVGHRVSVRGTSTPGDPRPTFKVRSISVLSESCTPQNH
jgi:hypothetical protein